MITTKFSRVISEDIFKHQETQTVPYKYYLGLSSTLPSPTGDNISEPPESAGYARVEIENSEEIFGSANCHGEVSNHTSVYFPESTAAWPDIVAFVICDSPTGGNMLAYGAFNEPIQILVNTIISIPFECLRLKVLDGASLISDEQIEAQLEQINKENKINFAAAIKPKCAGNPVTTKDSINGNAVSVSIGGTTTQNPIRHITAPVITADNVTGGQKMPTRLVSDTISDFTGKKVEVLGKNLIPKTIKGKAPSIANGEVINGDYHYVESIRVDSTKNYCFSVNNPIEVQEMYIFAYDSNGKFLGFEGTKANKVNTAKLFPQYPTTAFVKLRRGGLEDMQLQFELGTEPTAYKPYKGITYTANADGTVDGVLSIEGNMTMLTDSGADIDVVIPEPIVNGDVGEITDTDGADRGFIEKLSQRYELSKWDKIYKDAEGWKIEKRTSTVILNSDTYWYRLKDWIYYCELPKKYEYTDTGEIQIVYSNLFPYRRTIYTDPIPYSYRGVSYDSAQSSRNIFFGTDNTDIKTVDDWKAFVKNNPITATYKLAEPVITPLPQADADILDKIETFYPNTTISADGNVVLNIQYVADTEQWVLGKIDELANKVNNINEVLAGQEKI